LCQRAGHYQGRCQTYDRNGGRRVTHDQSIGQ
jgi:hypothetical protein